LIKPTFGVICRNAANSAKLVVVLPSFMRVAAMKIRLVVLFLGAVSNSLVFDSVDMTEKRFAEIVEYAEIELNQSP